MDEQSRVIAAEAAVNAVLEPPRRRFFSRRAKGAPRGLVNCENCGAALTGPYCGRCGQHAIDYRRSFGRVFLDALDSLLNWDSRLFASLALLLTRPWKLTNDFLAGKRVRYVHPLRLYLLASILFFFLVNYAARDLRFEPGRIPENEREKVAAEIQKRRSAIERELEKENLSADERKKTQEALDYLTKPNPSPAVSPAPSAAATWPALTPSPTATADQSEKRTYGPVADRDFVVFDDAKSSTPFERWVEARAKEKMGEHGTKMGLFLTTLFSNLPYMMLCCIPLFAVVLKVLYLRRRILYIDHLVYALHIHSFAYLAIVLIVLVTIGLNRTTPGPLAGWTIGLLWCAFVGLIFLSIRRVYRQGWFMSVLKFFFGGFVYLIVLCVALAITFFITLVLPTS